MKSIHSLIQVPSYSPRGLDLLSWDDRRAMQAAEGREFTVRKLTELMGSLHVYYPAYKERGRSLLPLPNLAGRQPLIECSDGGIWTQIKMFISWVAR